MPVPVNTRVSAEAVSFFPAMSAVQLLEECVGRCARGQLVGDPRRQSNDVLLVVVGHAHASLLDGLPMRRIEYGHGKIVAKDKKITARQKMARDSSHEFPTCIR